MSRYAKILLVIALVDLVSTVCGIKIGYCEEANPLLSWALGTGGINLFVTLKIGFSALVVRNFGICLAEELNCQNNNGALLANSNRQLLFFLFNRFYIS